MKLLLYICLLHFLVGSNDAAPSLYDRLENKSDLAGRKDAIPDPSKGFGLFPCPEPEVVAPCLCYMVGESHMNMDCSNVTSDEELSAVFSRPFPVTKFFSLGIKNNEKVKTLKRFENGTTFEEVNLENTGIENVAPDALSNSLNTLQVFRALVGALTTQTFGLDTPKFSRLQTLSMREQSFKKLPSLSSDTLHSIDFSVNTIETLEPEDFNFAPIATITLTGNKITRVPRDVFKLADRDGTIHLDFNSISEVEPGAFVLPNSREYFSLVLSMQHNQLTTLPQAVYGEIFPYLTRFNVADNPLDCDCDIAWIVLNPAYSAKITSTTKCVDGTLFSQLDPAYYSNYCDITSTTRDPYSTTRDPYSTTRDPYSTTRYPYSTTSTWNPYTSTTTWNPYSSTTTWNPYTSTTTWNPYTSTTTWNPYTSSTTWNPYSETTTYYGKKRE